MLKLENETAFEYMSRVISWLRMENGEIIDSLPSVAAVIEYAALFDAYDTDFMSGIEEAILDGEDPKPLRDFVRKYKLQWDLSWVPSSRQRRKLIAQRA